MILGAGLLIGAGCLPGLFEPAPPPDPARVALQSADLPSDLRRCPASGPVEAYVKHLAVTDPQGSAELEQGWAQLEAAGAEAGVLVVYAADSHACDAEPGSGPGRAAGTLVVRFGDDAAAEAAYPKGVLGFPTPGQDEEEPGLSQGMATQLGPRSWLLQRTVAGRFLTVAYWQSHRFTVLFVSVDLDTVESKRALLAVHARTT